MGSAHAPSGFAQGRANPGLQAEQDCEAQWVYGGPENTYPIQPSCTRIIFVHE